MKSHADYSQFDTSTDEGRRALLENLNDEAIAFAEALEPVFRDPRTLQRRRIDAAVMHNVFAREFLDVTYAGAPIVKSDVNEFGPLAALVMQMCPLLTQTRLGAFFAALDDVRAARDRRRNGRAENEPAAESQKQNIDESVVEIDDVPDEDEQLHRVASREMVP